MLLAVKLALVPLLIAAISLAGARLGPRVAGALTRLPVVANPVALFLALEQGPAFAARAAAATLAGEGSLALFCVLYAWTCVRAPWWVSVLAGWAGFALARLLVDRLAPWLPGAAAIALLAPAAVLVLSSEPASPRPRDTAPPGDVGLRMAAADALGPRLSGLLTVFPVAVSVLAVFSHRGQGGPFAVHLLRGLALGLHCLTAFFAALALGLERLGVAWGFAVAVVASLATQVVVLRMLRRG